VAETPTVLVTGMGSTTAMSVVKALGRQDELDVRVVGVDIHARDEIAGSSFCDSFFTVPPAASEEYIPTLLDITEREGVRVVHPIVDPEVAALAANRDRFAAIDAVVWAGPAAAVRACNDKLAAHDALTAAGFRTPQTWSGTDVRAVDALPYPLIVKPAAGVSSRDVVRVDGASELEHALERVAGAVVQPFVAGREYTVDVVADAHGTPLAAVPRERVEVKAGVSTKGRTVDEPELAALATDVVRALGLIGPVNVQVIVGDDGPTVLEINPRFSAGLALTVAAGVNAPLILLELALGLPVHEDECRYEPRVFMARYWEECFYRGA
jgi:carbamoyl-phosphate synthase large subunit